MASLPRRRSAWNWSTRRKLFTSILGMASVKVFVERWWYHVLVVIVRGEFRSATAQVQKEVAEEEGIEPSLEWVKGLIDYVLQTEFGTRDLEFAWEEKQVVDEIQQEAILSGYTSRGIITVNEAREQLGMDPCQEPAAEVLDERMKAMVRDLHPLTGGCRAASRSRVL
jgi:hypothetical protein